MTKKTSGIVENVSLLIRCVAVRITGHNTQHNVDPQRRHLLLVILQKPAKGMLHGVILF